MQEGADGNSFLPNSRIAELLALAAEKAKMPLQKALRRASRKAFLWTDEASMLVQEGRSLTELSGVGPHLNRIIRNWIEAPPSISNPLKLEGHSSLCPKRVPL